MLGFQFSSSKMLISEVSDVSSDYDTCDAILVVYSRVSGQFWTISTSKYAEEWESHDIFKV